LISFIDTYLILKTFLGVILSVWKKGADPRPSPAKDGNNKGDLSFIAWMDEMIIVDGPECPFELDQLLLAEQMLRLFLIYDQTLLGQGMPYPLAKC